MSAYLKSCRVPRCIEVVRPLEMTILYLVGDFTGMDAGWEFDFQELVTLMP